MHYNDSMQVATKTRGRPTVFDNDTVHKLEQAFNIGCTVEEACLVSGVSRSAYYKKIETDPDFMDKMERSKLFTVLMARNTVCQAIMRGDVKTSMWYLERKRRDEFGKCNHENNVSTSNIDINFDAFTVQELEKIAGIIK